MYSKAEDEEKKKSMNFKVLSSESCKSCLTESSSRTKSEADNSCSVNERGIVGLGFSLHVHKCVYEAVHYGEFDRNKVSQGLIILSREI